MTSPSEQQPEKSKTESSEDLPSSRPPDRLAITDPEEYEADLVEKTLARLVAQKKS